MRIISLIGIVLKKRYCVIEQIGQGGEGQLYLARDLELGKLWAVKELPLERKQEAKLMRLLEHPFLPKMTDYAERGDFCYLVMEFIKGKSLKAWSKTGRVFSLEEIMRMGIDAAEVLSYLHMQKPPVYYGDLKPDNLMLTEEGRLYLVDLGSAVLGYEDRTQICQGTVGYAAPEQFEGRVNAASDVYALGKTLSALCGKNRIRYVMENLRFGVLLWKCCRKEEKYRYQDMGAVRNQMNAVLDACRNRKKRRLGYGVLLLAVILAVAAVFSGAFEKQTLEESLTAVTEEYYGEQFLYGTGTERQEICRNAEKKLQNLLKKYPEKESQRKLLLLLALNGELQGEAERAAVYYEQILLYDMEFGEAYGQYGLFLCRQGQQEESLRLWNRYDRMKEEIEEMSGETKRAWEERLGDCKDEGNEENAEEVRKTGEKQKQQAP